MVFDIPLARFVVTVYIMTAHFSQNVVFTMKRETLRADSSRYDSRTLPMAQLFRAYEREIR